MFLSLELSDCTSKWLLFLGSLGPYEVLPVGPHAWSPPGQTRNEWKAFPEREVASGSTRDLYLFLTKREKALRETVCQNFQFKPLAVTILTESWKNVPDKNSTKEANFTPLSLFSMRTRTIKNSFRREWPSSEFLHKILFFSAFIFFSQWVHLFYSVSHFGRS